MTTSMRQLKRKTPQENMLRDVLAETNPKVKREIIKSFNQFHYVFGTALTRIKQEDLLTGVNTKGGIVK